MQQIILSELNNIKTKNVKEFSSKIYNTTLKIIGVKVPLIKELAKKYKDADLSNIKINEYVEIDMLLGFINKYKFKDYKERLYNLEYLFVNDSSWAITDSVIAFNKKNNKEINMFFMKRWVESSYTYLRRLGYVIYLDTLKDDEEALDYILIKSNDTNIYYIDMAISWALATAAIKFNQKVYDFLANLDKSSFIKTNTIKKIKESFRIEDSIKNKFKSLLKGEK